MASADGQGAGSSPAPFKGKIILDESGPERARFFVGLRFANPTYKAEQEQLTGHMRNIFDQYSQQENRLTHALMCALTEDKKLLQYFIRWITGKAAPKKIKVVEQQLPDEPELGENESEKRGLPDAWIFDENNWSLLIESKISATLKNDQLQRHYNTALRRGFSDITLLAIDTVKPKTNLPPYVSFRNWSEIYTWLCAQSNYSDWALKTARFMEVAESKWVAEGYLKEGALTVFSGIPFSDDNS